MKGDLGIFLYNRLFDPLIQSNFWLYIESYLNHSDGKFRIFLITYENENFPLTSLQTTQVAYWESKGLIWVKLKWNPGTGIVAKIKDIAQGFFAVVRLRLKGCRHFVSLASIAGSFLFLYHVVLRFRFFLYQFEPHSEYAIDNKMWKKDSIQYKLAHFLERKAASHAYVIASGTRFMQQRLKEEWKVKAAFFKIPTVANDKKFRFLQTNRDAMRKRLGLLDEQRVLFYPGKFGDLYYKIETPLMFKWLKECDPSFHFLIVTPHTDEEVMDLFESADVTGKDYTIAHSDYSEIHHYFAAADFAVIAVPPGPSKKFISNIKVGEYLTAGLPYLITEGVSEDYLFAMERGVGVVVKDFKEEFIKSAFPAIDRFLNEDRAKLRERCLQAGLAYRGFEKLNVEFQRAINYLYS